MALIACNQNNPPKLSAADSLKIHYKATAMTDSFIKKIKTEAGNKIYNESISSCPVLIKKCFIKKEDYGAKDIVVRVKNNSNKKVHAIKISRMRYNNLTS